MNLQMPSNIDSLKGLKVYVFNGEKDGRKIYFDNLKIHRFTRDSIGKISRSSGLNIELTNYDSDQDQFVSSSSSEKSNIF